MSSHCKAAYKTADVCDEAANKALVEETIRLYGKIDVLILCAGVSAHQMFTDMKDMSMLRQVMETNFYGYVILTKAALNVLRENKGQIVVINSISALIGMPFRSHYSASKFAIRGFFESIANEEPAISVLNVYAQQMIGTAMRKNALVP